MQSRLAYLTNKCSGEADLEYYIAEAGHILGLRMPEGAGARSVLGEVFQRLARWKMVGSALGGTEGLAGTGGDTGATGAGGPGGFDHFEL